MSLADAFNIPLAVNAGGKDYRLAFLGMEDQAALSVDQAQDQKQRALKGVGLTDRQRRSEITAYYDGVELDLYELARDASTLGGSRRFLRRSLTATGHAPAEAEQFLTDFAVENGTMAMADLSMRVSRLFRPTEADHQRARALPNGGPASSDGPADAGSETGSPSTTPPPSDESGEPRPASTSAA